MTTDTREPGPWSPHRAILVGTVVVGVLDMLDALVFFGLRGIRLGSIPQSIAGGLLGRAAFRGGIPTIVLGTAIHFCIAFAVVSTYFLASQRLPILTRWVVPCGLLYGVGVFYFMNLVVVPLSAAATAGPMAPAVLLNGLLIHAFGVGLPSAVVARLAQTT